MSYPTRGLSRSVKPAHHALRRLPPSRKSTSPSLVSSQVEFWPPVVDIVELHGMASFTQPASGGRKSTTTAFDCADACGNESSAAVCASTRTMMLSPVSSPLLSAANDAEKFASFGWTQCTSVQLRQAWLLPPIDECPTGQLKQLKRRGFRGESTARTAPRGQKVEYETAPAAWPTRIEVEEN